jgi:hypothetical protein
MAWTSTRSGEAAGSIHQSRKRSLSLWPIGIDAALSPPFQISFCSGIPCNRAFGGTRQAVFSTLEACSWPAEARPGASTNRV